MLTLAASPKIHVAYEREAYVTSDNNDIRVTLDRHVRGVARPGGELTARMEDPQFCITDIAVLELKFTRRFPNWYQRLVETFHLVQCGAAKYVECTTLHHSRDLPEADIARRMVL
jgi:hypothetical protein